VIKKDWQSFVAFSLPLQIILVQVISAHPAWVERFYSARLYSFISQGLRRIFGSTTIPVGQIIFYGLVLGMVIGIGRQTHKLFRYKAKRPLLWRKTILGVFFFLSVFYFLFMVTWGLNYYRAPVANITAIPAEAVAADKLQQLCVRLVALTNTSRNRLEDTAATFISLPANQRQELLRRATIGYKAVAQMYPRLAYNIPSVKSVYVPEIMSSFRVGGIYFPFTGEANVNMHQPAFILPATICHEMAHQIGFASEDEANYISFLTCRLNPDPAFQYSGNLMAMRYALNRLYGLDSVAFRHLEKQLSPKVTHDLEINRKYWESFPNPFLDLTSGFYDLFLKANGQRAGIESYSQMVELLLGELEKNNLEYRLPPK